MTLAHAWLDSGFHFDLVAIPVALVVVVVLALIYRHTQPDED